MPPSSSSKSTPSSSSDGDDVAGAAPAQGAQEAEDATLNLHDPSPWDGRVDPQLRSALRMDQRTVYMWTFPATDVEDHAKPADFSRESFAQLVVRAYEETGKVVTQWVCSLETHPSSRSTWEQRNHFHMMVETEKPARWCEVARFLRREGRVFASAATASERKS